VLYHVTLGGRTYQVELGDGGVAIDGAGYSDAELLEVPGTTLHHLLLGGRSHTLAARAGAARGSWELHIDGVRLEADVVDERTRAIRALTRAPEGSQGPRPVRAPMPGLVLRVEVQPGQHVSRGQGVVIMEAMKMENELRTETDGVVARVLVNAGEPVEKGAVLIEFAREVQVQG
jgi:pyruvate carboxylase subunit B